MEDKNITNPTNEVKQTKPVQAAKKDNDKDTFADYKAEFKKISWPDKTTLLKQSVVVITISIVLGLLITFMDTVIQYGVNLLTM